MAPPTRPTQLAEHDAALADLLGDLLAEVPDTGPPTVDETEGVRSTEGADALVAAAADSLASQASHASPDWGSGDFRALLFRIGDQRFSVPLVALHSVAKLDTPLTTVPGQPSWHLGVVGYRGQTLVVADLGQLLGVAASLGCPRFLLVLGEGREAIACDSIDEPLNVGRDGVRWASSTDQQPWRVGVLTSALCVLLDPDAIGNRIRHV